ncbi:hypothetical protein OG802_35010 [Streptomyces sp. NBC_00704]|uniref:hypothetical protein n=1 Tax=Streptomyces sp. NBC_00704 TaxID=2975809 RepID=UPI002E352074|nr:hypothetical protein [Streptomyces sp. NBC_00704]
MNGASWRAPLGWTVSEPSGPLEPFSVDVVPLDTRRSGVPLTRREEARLAAATNEAFGRLITAGIDFAVLAVTAPKGPITFGPALKSKDDVLRERAEAVIRQWEADGRPLSVIYLPEPIKFRSTPGAWIDTAALEKELRRRCRLVLDATVVQRLCNAMRMSACDFIMAGSACGMNVRFFDAGSWLPMSASATAVTVASPARTVVIKEYVSDVNPSRSTVQCIRKLTEVSPSAS